MSFSEEANKIFDDVVIAYHKKDDVDTPIENP